MIVFTSNIRNFPDLRNAQVQSDTRKILSRLRFSVGGWQEIAELDDHRAIDRASDKHSQLFKSRDTPITLRNGKFRVLKSGGVTVHGPVGPNISPERGFVWLKMKRRRRPYRPFVFINTHMISGAWTLRDTPKKHERRMKWTRHFNALRAKVHEFHAQGYTVILVGDFNRVDFLSFHKNQQEIHSNGVDHIFYIPHPKGARFKVKKKGKITDLHTDHVTVWAKLKQVR